MVYTERGKALAMSKKKYFCYVIQADEYVKIGFTNNISRRMDTLQTGHHRELKLLVSYPYRSADLARTKESLLHQQFVHCRVRGEWFKAAPVKRFITRQKFIRAFLWITVL